MHTCHFNLSAVCCGQDFVQVLLLLPDLAHHLTVGWGMDQGVTVREGKVRGGRGITSLQGGGMA